MENLKDNWDTVVLYITKLNDWSLNNQKTELNLSQNFIKIKISLSLPKFSNEPKLTWLAILVMILKNKKSLQQSRIYYKVYNTFCIKKFGVENVKLETDCTQGGQRFFGNFLQVFWISSRFLEFLESLPGFFRFSSRFLKDHLFFNHF